MKKYIFTALIIPFFIVGQELDEAYLDSLPIDVKDDVLSTIDAKSELDKPIYRKASTMIDKKDDKNTNYSKVEDPEIDDKKNEIFGKNFFDVMQTSFMPTNEPNFDGQYILDYGDVLEIQLVGQEDDSYEIDIKRDGSINLPDIGKITLAGLTLSEASKLIKVKINNVYIGTEAYITLINIRDIQIVVTGNAYNPGIYTLNGNSNILFALSMAGGINEDGSYRSIDLVRNGKVIDNFDLYDVFINGKFTFKNRLRSGDSIVVNPQANIVTAISGVRRPGLYEMLPNESIDQLIAFANGLSQTADISKVRLHSFVNGKLETFIMDYDLLIKKKNRNNDSIVISENKFNTIEILGAVKYPGSYKISKGATLSSLLEIAGGYEDYAYPFGGFLNNIQTKEINKLAKDRIYKQFIQNIIESPQVNIEKDTLPLILHELKNTPDVGRIIAEFNLDIIKDNPKLDTILQDGDEILIPSVTQQVFVYGEVMQSGAVRYSANKSVSYYIENSGGLTKTAEEDNIFIVNPNGETQLTKITRSKLLGSLNNENLIYPGSIIFIPRTSDITNRTQLAAVWAPILSSFALSAASISSISK
jgi:protein involved in polysaccharide export with SLBB domain